MLHLALWVFTDLEKREEVVMCAAFSVMGCYNLGEKEENVNVWLS